MQSRKFFLVLSLLVIAATALSACGRLSVMTAMRPSET